jgi:hypothetical protein
MAKKENCLEIWYEYLKEDNKLGKNIKMAFKEILPEIVDWNLLSQDREHWWALVNTVMKFRVP